jgi:citrate lyase subunit beta / citryl-CoA lyase
MNRSYLMVAADKEKHLDKLNDLKCDVAMINLEDGVCDKSNALELLSKKFKKDGLKCKNKKIVVRINPLDEGGESEIKVLNSLKPDAIRISKVKTIDDVKIALNLIDEDIKIHLSIETKEALENLTKLRVDKRVETVYLGILDMLESLCLPQSLVTLDNPTVEYILSRFLIDSKIAGFNPVSFTYQDYKNTQEFENWCKKTKKMGFQSKSCISPTQVDIVNKIFTIDEKIIEKAKYIKNIFENKRDAGITGFSDEKYGFIDEPIYKDSLLIINNNRS